MDLKTYAATRGAAAQLARALGVSSATVSFWISGDKQVPAERCMAIEAATDGAVRCEDLRPDLQWGVLRERRAAERRAAA
jgi:DNA-binding transcriptional regulator YdaS (Cro superfamily)